MAGSLTEGLTMRISPDTDIEQLKTGKFVAIQGEHQRFFCLVTDLKLEVTHPDILLFPQVPKNRCSSKRCASKIFMRPHHRVPC